MTKCPPVYRNLGLLSFDEQRYVTVEMLRQMCKNDEWLKQNLERIEYLTPPAIRKRFTPIWIDESSSFGCSAGTDNIVTFDNAGIQEVYVDFDDTSMIDAGKTTCSIISKLENGEVIKAAETPIQTVSTINRETKDESPWPGTSGLHCNEHWYIGFDKNRQYHIQPNWLFGDESVGYGIYNTEIPAIGRAQSFKPKVSGFLEGITVNLKCDIDKNNTASPLIVQLRPTVTKNGVAYPANFQYTMLAEERVRFSNSTPDICTISFTHPPYVEKGKSYAMVFLSPLSHPYNCFHLGGWSKNCGADPYPDGDAFYTWNNGANWTRYGKGEDVSYSNGRFPPVDFAFELQIREDTEEFIQNEEFYLYLQPIRSNPVKKVEINANDNVEQTGISIVYQVSNNGRDWYNLSKNQTLEFDNPRNMTFIRAKMMTTRNEPAHIQDLKVALTTEAPTEMYARTYYYYPKTSPMLGANTWGRVYAPFETEATVDCQAEIISEKEVIEHFTTIELLDIIDYVDVVPEIVKNKVEGKTELQICNYLEDNPSVVEAFKKLNIYILPFKDKNDEWHHFFDQFEFINSPAYPILDCTLQPTETGEVTRYFGEWYDYLFNYGDSELNESVTDPNTGETYEVSVESDCMMFYRDILESRELFPKGTFSITYNPLVIDHLTNTEVGQHVDDNNEGLILDYFKETFVVTEEVLENRTLTLRTAPADPIRKVVVNPDDDNLEVREDIDFTVDYDAHTITFEIVNTDNESTILNLNDVVEVVYTPNIEDVGLSIGYYATRENVRKNVYIKPNYMEYKV